MDSLQSFPFSSISNSELFYLSSSSRTPSPLNPIDFLQNLDSDDLLSDLNDASIPNLNNLGLDQTIQNCAYTDLADQSIWPVYRNSFTILHINCRSLNKNLSKLEQFLNYINLKPLVIALSETWIKQSAPVNYFSINNYNFISKPRSKNKRGGGVALYIHNSLEFTEIKIPVSATDETFDLCAIEIKNNSGANIIIAEIYKPPDTNISVFLNLFSNFLESINNSKKLICVSGDFNIDLLPSSRNKTSASKFQNILLSNGFLPAVNLPTRITPSSSTLIDNFFINKTTTDSFSKVIFDDLSDHLPILLNYNLTHNPKLPLTTPVKKPKRIFSQRNFLTFLQLVSNENWHLQTDLICSTANITYVNESYNNF
jgi:Endonuclease-reverse transcriptase